MTLAEATTLRALWLAAEQAVAIGQEYTIAGRTLIRADASFIHRQFLYYDGLCTALAAGRGSGITLRRPLVRDI